MPCHGRFTYHLDSGVNMKKLIYKIMASTLAVMMLVSCSKTPKPDDAVSSDSQSSDSIQEIWNIDPELYWSFSDLYDNAEISGKLGETALVAQNGESLKLFDQNGCEIIDMDVRISDGQTLKKLDSDGNILKDILIKVEDTDSLSEQNDSDKVTKDEPSADDDKNIITVLVPSGCEGIKEAAQQYENKHKNIKIDIVEKDFKKEASVVNYLSDLKENDRLFDLVFMNQKHVASAYSKGLISELSEFDANELSDKFTPSCLDGVKIGDSAIALPVEATVSCFISNPDILSSCDISMPGSSDELFESCEKIKNYTGEVFPIGISCGEDYYEELSSLFLSYIWSSNSIFSDNGSVAFSADDWNNFMGYINNLYSKGLISENYTPSQLFSGKTAFGFGSSSSYKNLFGSLAKYNFNCYPFSKVLSESYISELTLSVLALGKTDDQTKTAAAYDFAKFFALNRDCVAQNCISRSTVPALISAQKTESFANDVWKTYIEQLEHARCFTSFEANSVIKRYIYDAIIASTAQGADINSEYEKVITRINNRFSREI